MNIPSKDIDLVCLAPSFEEMETEIKNLGGKIFLSKPQYFTARCMFPDIGSCDVRLARTEGHYEDGRHPSSVAVATSLLEDQRTRDFTINSIAQDIETGEIIDPFNGQADIKTKTLRCVGNARDRFTEDGLRMLRAMRFVITKGFVLDQSIVECLSQPVFFEERFKGVSEERIREELFKCFKYNTINTLRFFDKFPRLRDYIFMNTTMWLKPTSEA